MTEKLYDADAYLFSFDATVVSCTAEGEFFSVVLDRTAFFPEGGGQGADRGTLNDLPVCHVRLADGVIYHRLATAIAPGTAVHGQVDEMTRLRRMQDHTGEHIFSGLVHSRFGYENVGFHLGDGEMTMDYSGELTAEQVSDLERDANLIIRQNRPVTCVYPDQATLDALSYRSKKELTGPVRIVTVEGVDVCACCAPHVSTTAQVGTLVITDRVRWKGGVRLHARCGADAFDWLDLLRRDENALSSLFSAPRGQIFPAAEKLSEENKELHRQLSELRREQAFSRVEAFSPKVADGLLCLAGADGNLLREAALAFAQKCTGVAVCVTPDGCGLRYAMASAEDLSVRANEICTALNGKGGGDRRLRQGRFNCDLAAAEAYFAE